jgi:galactofuranose transport system permease protein
MRLQVKYSPVEATALVCALLYTAASIHYPAFFSLRVLINFFADNSFLGIIAVGMTLVIISGGIDLSVGAVMALCATTIASLITDHHLAPLVTMPIALAIGTGMGLAMGCVVYYLKIEPFIATLAGMFLARGTAEIISPSSIPIENHFYSRLSEMGIPVGAAQIPITAIALLAVVAAGVYIASYTPFGRNLYAIGGDENAATLMGLPVGRTKVLVYTISGFCAALAAIVFTVYQSAGNPVAGMGMELDAIAIVVIGGTLLQGGSGSVFGTLIGTLIFGIIQTGITFQGNLSSWWTKVAIGVLLLLFILLQKALSGTMGRKRL